MTEPTNPNTPADEARFWKKVNKTSGCWLWTSSRTAVGYGKFRCQGLTRSAHRISWLLAFGEIPDGLFVCHHCDNRVCVRPDHLFLGTNSDNQKDMRSKGRGNDQRGESHAQAKLTNSQVIEMRNKYASGGYSERRISREYKISVSHAHGILAGKNWKHIAGAKAQESNNE